MYTYLRLKQRLDVILVYMPSDLVTKLIILFLLGGFHCNNYCENEQIVVDYVQ
jgi:hypothetical protein